MPLWFMQEGHLSPGEAKRLHTMSSAVPLPSPGPESDSDGDVHDDAPHDDADVKGKSMTPDTDRAASDSDWVQPTASESGGSSSASGSSVSSAVDGMTDTGSGSVAPTEIQDDDQDATVVIGQAAALAQFLRLVTCLGLLFTLLHLACEDWPSCLWPCLHLPGLALTWL